MITGYACGALYFANTLKNLRRLDGQREFNWVIRSPSVDTLSRSGLHVWP
jgi:hypothetical protein